MTKALKLLCLSILALVAAGCGKKVLVPEKTIVAAYIDFEKAYDKGKSVAETLLDAMPSSEKKEARKEYDEAVKMIDKIKDKLDVEWAVVAFGGDLKSLARHPENNIAVAIKVSADEKAVIDVLNDMSEADGVKHSIKAEKKNGHIVFVDEEEDDPSDYMGLVDGKYLIASPSKDAFEDMFDLYAGKGKASDEFGDLSKISGDTVCRISTAPVSSLLKRFELTRYVEKFGEACDDNELVDMVLNMGAISLDVNVGDELGVALHVDCDSSSDAKTIESLMRSAAFISRVAFDGCAYLGKDTDVAEDLGLPRSLREIYSNGKDLYVNLAKGVEADRSGSVATLSLMVETEKLAEFIKKMAAPEKKKKSSRYDDDDDDFSFFGGKKEAKAKPALTNCAVAVAKDAPAKPASPYYDYGTKKDEKKSDSSFSSYSSYRANAQKATCISNMKELQAAAELYMMDHNSTPTVYDLCGPDKLIRKRPTCPSDGSSYRIYRKGGEIKVSCPNAYKGHEL